MTKPGNALTLEKTNLEINYGTILSKPNLQASLYLDLKLV